MTDKIKELMTLLDCTEKEAIDIIETDNDIDHNKRVYFDLDKEDEKAAKKWANVTEHKVNAVDAYGRKRTRTRKEDVEKDYLIQLLQTVLSFKVQDLTQTKSGTIEFYYNNRKFRIVLSAPTKT